MPRASSHCCASRAIFRGLASSTLRVAARLEKLIDLAKFPGNGGLGGSDFHRLSGIRLRSALCNRHRGEVGASELALSNCKGAQPVC